jgi:hypothetical protein
VGSTAVDRIKLIKTPLENTCQLNDKLFNDEAEVGTLLLQEATVTFAFNERELLAYVILLGSPSINTVGNATFLTSNRWLP